jgi:hypothetical protein
MVARASDLDPDTRSRFGLDGALDCKPARKQTQNSIAEDRFGMQLLQYGLPPFIHHHRFPQSLHPGNKRKVWIADYCNIEFKLMVEIDGGIFSGGAHGHPVDITRNMMKQNDAAILGFHTLRFATTWVKNKHAIEFLQRVLATKGWRPNV